VLDHVKTGFKDRPRRVAYDAFRTAHRPANDTPELARERARLRRAADREQAVWTEADSVYVRAANAQYVMRLALGATHDEAVSHVMRDVPDPRLDPVAMRELAERGYKRETQAELEHRLLHSADIDPDAHMRGDNRPEAKQLRSKLRRERRLQKALKASVARAERHRLKLQEMADRDAQRIALRALGGPARRAALTRIEREQARLRRVGKQLALSREDQWREDMIVCLRLGRQRHGPRLPMSEHVRGVGRAYVPRIEMR
jgi:hypothetical protein